MSAHTVGASIASLFILIAGGARAEAKPSATPIALSGASTVVQGRIDGGETIPLDWAQASAVACFPGNHFDAFAGKHVLYRFDLPAKSTAKIKLRSTSKSADLNLYAYRAGVGERLIPPVYVGVAGYKGVTSGDFELVVDLVAAAADKTGRVTVASPVKVEIGKTATVDGKLDPGVEIPLGWAENSNVACFGAHRFKHFEGKHVVYRFDQPPSTSLAVRVIPKDPKLDVSLYVYRVSSGDTTSLPPAVHSASCEASFGKSDLEVSPNPGDAEGVDGMITLGNPYTVYIGVAGAAGVTAGDFTLEIELKAR